LRTDEQLRPGFCKSQENDRAIRSSMSAVTFPSPETAVLTPVAAPRQHGAAILSLGTALPQHAVPSEAIGERLGVSAAWIESRTGVRERRVAEPGLRLSELASAAGRAALERAELDPAELDLVIVATFTADELVPNAAPLVAAELGASRAGAFDVGAACTGFLTALSLATAQIESGRAAHLLVVGADLVTRFTDFDDRRTAALFGDGAGAAVVGRVPGSGRIGPAVLGSDGGGAPHIYATRSERLIRMDGHETFKAAVARLADVTVEALDKAGATLNEVDLFVYHQANARILAAVAERLELPADRVVNAIETLGNTSAASIPLALAAAEENGALGPGSRVLLAAFGAGFTWGAVTLEWGAGDA
jgi:3-oxoacyl-[acyl-carrier-protein] synthase III